MLRKQCVLALFILILPGFGATGHSLAGQAGPVLISTDHTDAVLWRNPADLSTRNLYYGIGGKEDQPVPPYTFESEDMNGSNPKYIVRDANNVKWTVKLGLEARPETAATRLVWAAGYFTNEDYFVPELKVSGMPAHLKRGRKLVSADGTMYAARLKRHVEGEKNVGAWRWRSGPFTGSQQLNGLKVMMALIDNWDMKDVNNKIYSQKGTQERLYMVGDLGASFGASGLSYPFRRSKGDLREYERAKFITRITPEYVNFRTPSRPALVYLVSPFSYIQRTRLDSLTRHIPREDARWIGTVLSGLSSSQIRDAFRAAGYSPAQTDLFTAVVRERILELNSL